jgi:hypothetical protein
MTWLAITVALVALGLIVRYWEYERAEPRARGGRLHPPKDPS